MIRELFEPMSPADAKRARELQDRYPVELRPNPGYEYQPPYETVVDGVLCVSIDAGAASLGVPLNKARGGRGRG
ncbi:hypothetical protein ABE488_09135 [Luteimonas sp. TWI662]|uniref:hypothetical protein n=1 Tax=Luteimonas sp. TWI662 TaxID=3136789 RepID=UPI003209E9B8